MVNRLFSNGTAPNQGSTQRIAHRDLGLVEAANQITGAVLDVHSENKQLEAVRDDGDLSLEATRELNDLSQKHLGTEKWRGNVDGFNETSSSLVTKYSSQIKDDARRVKFRQWFESAIETKRSQLQGVDHSKEITSRKRAFDANINSFTDQYLKASSKEDRDQIEDSIKGAIDASVATGVYEYQHGEALKKQHIDTLKFNIAQRNVKNDPAQSMVDLGGSKKVSYADLKKALVWQESRGKTNAESPVGASGLMQVMPGTARHIAQQLGEKQLQGKSDAQVKAWLKVPTNGERYGSFYLKQQLSKYKGDAVLTLIAYNAGPGRADDWIKRYGDPRTGAISHDEFISKIPIKETKGYVKKIFAKMGVGTGAYSGQVSSDYKDLPYASIQALRTQAERGVLAFETQLTKTVSKINSAVSKGFLPDEKMISSAIVSAQKLGDFNTQEQLESYRELPAIGTALKTAPIHEIRKQVSEFKQTAYAPDATSQDIAKAKYGEAILKRVETAVKNDPIGHAIDSGQDYVKPINFDAIGRNSKGKPMLTPGVIGQLGAAFEARSDSLGTVDKFYQPKDARIFTNDERSNFKRLYDSGTASDKKQLSALIYENFGDDLPKALNEIAKNSATNALTISLSTVGDGRAAELANIGAVALRDKTVKLPKDNKVLEIFNATVGTSIPSEQRKTVLEVARQIYAGKMTTGGVDYEAFDEAEFKLSVSEALGRNGEKGGVANYDNTGNKFVLPTHFSLTDIEDIDGAATDFSLQKLAPESKPMHGDGTAFKPEELEGAFKISAGNGEYYISMTDPKVRIEYVVDETTGKPLKLNYKNIENVKDAFENGKRADDDEITIAEKILNIDDLAEYPEIKMFLNYKEPPYGDAELNEALGEIQIHLS